MILKNKIVCLFVLLLTSLSSSSQENPIARNIFFNGETSQVIDEWSIRYPNKEFHANFKPYLSNSLTQFHDSCVGYHHYTIKNFFLSKTFNEGPSKRNQYNFQFLPLVDLQTGFDVLNNKNVNELTGGLYAKLNINDDFTLEGTGFAGNVTYPFFTDTFIQNTKLIPGLGMAYRSGNSYNYSNFSGSASYSPNKILICKMVMVNILLAKAIVPSCCRMLQIIIHTSVLIRISEMFNIACGISSPSSAALRCS